MLRPFLRVSLRYGMYKMASYKTLFQDHSKSPVKQEKKSERKYTSGRIQTIVNTHPAVQTTRPYSLLLLVVFCCPFLRCHNFTRKLRVKLIITVKIRHHMHMDNFLSEMDLVSIKETRSATLNIFRNFLFSF